MANFRRVLAGRAPAAAILIRLAVGMIFLSEGIQKFLYPAQLGPGRFAKIGLPAPNLLAPMVGATEITCGALVLAGALTRFAAVPLICVMLGALTSTKLPMLLERGFWAAAHETRVDFAMLLGSLFLLIAGAGPWSVDARIARRDSGLG